MVFFSTTLTFWSSLSHSSLEISSEFGSECDRIDLCYCQYFFGGEGEREKEKKNKASIEFIALQMSGK